MGCHSYIKLLKVVNPFVAVVAAAVTVVAAVAVFVVADVDVAGVVLDVDAFEDQSQESFYSDHVEHDF